MSKNGRMKWKMILKKTEDSDVQLTGCPVTRTRQLNLDQLIPALGVHLCLQLEDWLKKTHTHKQTKVFLLPNPFAATVKRPSYTRTDRRRAL